MIEAMFDAVPVVFNPLRLLWLLGGVAIGLFVGLLPGLGGMVGMSILLPFIFGMDPFSGIALMLGMIAVQHTGDTFPSVLLGVPGSAGSQATIMDGYPLAQQGEGARALGAAFFSSMAGGIIGGVALLGIITIARPLVLALGSPELFMLSFLGLAIVGLLVQGAPSAGMVMAAGGLLLGSVGAAPGAAEYRYTFEWVYLYDGVPLAVFALGLFAFPEIVDLLIENRSISKSGTLGGSRMDGIKDAIENRMLVLRSALLGGAIGVIPGLGGSVVDWITYAVAARTSKNNEGFGSGDIRGVIAPESANNAKEGGALVPTLLFGIPGSGTMAMLLGGLTLLGVQAGPTMVTRDLDITLSIIWTLIIANIVAAAACLSLAGVVSKLSVIRASRLIPFLLVIMVVAAYQSSRHWGDIILFLVFGVVAWLMKQAAWPRAPMLIGFVLATPIERYLQLSLSRYGLEWLTRPGVIILGILLLLVILGAVMGKRPTQKVAAVSEPTDSTATEGRHRD